MSHPAIGRDQVTWLDGVIRGGGRARVVRRVASLYSGSITAATPCALPTALATAASSAQLAHAPLCMSAAAPKAPSSWPTSPPRPRPPPGRAAQPPPLRYTHHTTRLHILSHQEPSGVPRLSAVAGPAPPLSAGPSPALPHTCPSRHACTGTRR